MKRNNCRLAEKFRAKNIRTGRLTLTSNEKLGIFKKGRASSPISSAKVSYPNFSELGFLAKESQATVPEEERPKPSILVHHETLSSGSTFDALLENELFQILVDCHQLNFPYKDYVPRYPMNRILSLEDLKNICRGLDHLCAEKKKKEVLDHTAGNDPLQDCHASFGCTSNDSTYLSLESHAAEDLARHGEILDMFLDSFECFDEDVAMKVLAEVVELGAGRPELQEAGCTDYAQHMEAMTSHFLCDVPRTLQDGCGACDSIGRGEDSVISGTMHRRCDGTMVPPGHTSKHRDIGETPVNTTTLGTSLTPYDRQFQFPEMMLQTLSPRNTPVQVAVQNQQTTPSSRRPFWRCNRLY